MHKCSNLGVFKTAIIQLKFIVTIYNLTLKQNNINNLLSPLTVYLSPAKVVPQIFFWVDHNSGIKCRWIFKWLILKETTPEEDKG